MKKATLAMLCAVALTALNLAAETNLAANPAAWKATAPKDVAAPELTAIVDDANVPGVRITAVGDGPWQSMNATFKPGVKVNKDMKLTFKIRQHLRNAALTFYLELRQQGAPNVNQNINVEPNTWVVIEVPFNSEAWKGDHNKPVAFDTLTQFCCFPYRALDAKGLYYEISDLKIIDADGNALDLTDASAAK